MNDGDFELNKPGFYTVQNVEENDFLNEKLETQDYGIWYTVKFADDASTHLWQTKTPPVEGEKYWGWIEKTKSGKTTKFKWDKQNTPGSEGTSTKGYQKSPETEENIARAVALKAAVEFWAVGSSPSTNVGESRVLGTADTFLDWLQNKPVEAKKDPEETGFDKVKAQRDKIAEVFDEPMPDMPEDFLVVNEGEESE